jgi:hypothetical protein
MKKVGFASPKFFCSSKKNRRSTVGRLESNGNESRNVSIHCSISMERKPSKIHAKPCLVFMQILLEEGLSHEDELMEEREERMLNRNLAGGG